MLLAVGLPVGRDIAVEVVKQTTCVVSWCGALTNSNSANNGNELTEVGGVLSEAFHCSECLFCKLGPNGLKFYPLRKVLSVQLSGQRAERTVR